MPPAPTLAAPASQRFTLDGDHALERHLEQTCARVLSGIRGLIPATTLEAVLLGGGYGRGEGGVLRDPGGDRPYNDLEFYVVIRGNRHLSEFLYHRRLEVLGEILTHLADVEIEFKITSWAELAAQPISMFSYDLVAGHRIWSHPATPPLRGCNHHRIATTLPAAEATRLLMNRCSGLLFARAELARAPFTPAAADFVRRNIAKAQLACGDAVLTAHRLYHWSCRERHRRLAQLVADSPSPQLESVLAHHATGVEFKLHPAATATTHTALQHLHAQLTALTLQTWLDLESQRLGRSFPSVRAYALHAADQDPGSSRGRNFLLNFRANGLRLRTRPSPWRHPRQRVYRALALLLWEPETFSAPALRAQLEIELNARAPGFPEALAAYRTLWSRVR